MLRMIPVVRAGCASNAGGASFTFVTGDNDLPPRAFGVPTVFLSELENVTLANVSTLERFLWGNTIVPELRLIEDSLNRSLVLAVGLSPSEYRFRLDISEIEALNDSEDSLVAMQVSLVAAGVMTPNEVRARHGTRAVGGGAVGHYETCCRVRQLNVTRSWD